VQGRRCQEPESWGGRGDVESTGEDLDPAMLHGARSLQKIEKVA